MTQHVMEQTQLPLRAQAVYIAVLYHNINRTRQLLETTGRVQESDCLLATLGAQVCNYLKYSQGTVASLGHAIYPDCEDESNLFRQRLTDALISPVMTEGGPILFNLQEVRYINTPPIDGTKRKR
jgi:hypothetical protein